jgi:1-phosphatidylinositol-4-phosphate 5-kinase
MSAQESIGKSGSFFFFSKNKKLILKTITPTELDVLIGRVLYSYTKHIELNSGSTLARIYGAYEV